MVNQEKYVSAIPTESPGLVRRPAKKSFPGEFRKLLNAEFTTEGTIKSRPSAYFCGFFQDTGSGVSDSGLPQLGTRTTHATRLAKIIGHIRPNVSFGTFYTVSEAISGTDPGSGATHQLFCATSHASELETNTALTTGYGFSFKFNSNKGSFPGGVVHANVTPNNRKFIGALYYNNSNYFIVSIPTAVGTLPDGTTGATTFGIWMITTTTIPKDGGTLVPAATYDTGIRVSHNKIDNVEWSLHRERLWLVAGDSVYFSKTGDLLTWVTPTTVSPDPDAGFFIFPGEDYFDLQGLGDMVYVSGPGQVKAINYATNPNTDGSVVPVNTSFGGHSITAYGSNIYFVRFDALWSISGTSVSKVKDLDLGLVEGINTSNLAYINNDPSGNSLLSVKVYPYRNYLIIRVVSPTNVSTFSSVFTGHHIGSPLCELSYPGSLGQYGAEPDYIGDYPRAIGQAYFVNMDNGATHEFGHRVGTTVGTSDIFTDVSAMHVIPGHANYDEILYFNDFYIDYDASQISAGTTNYLDGVGTDSVLESATLLDAVYRYPFPQTPSTSWLYSRPEVQIEISNLYPGNRKFNTAKWRAFGWVGKGPEVGFSLSGADGAEVSSDRYNWHWAVTLGTEDSYGPRYPNPVVANPDTDVQIITTSFQSTILGNIVARYDLADDLTRVGVNARGKSFSICLYTEPSYPNSLEFINYTTYSDATKLEYFNALGSKGYIYLTGLYAMYTETKRAGADRSAVFMNAGH